MTRILVATLLASALAAGGAGAQQAGSEGMGMKSPMGQQAQQQAQMSAEEFFKEAAGGGMFEVAAGKLAQEAAEDPQVKEFGQRMVTDHGKANDELAQVAKKIDMSMPSDMDSKHQQTMDTLKDQKGAAFDGAYMREMVSDHRKDVATFQSYAQNGDNPDLKQFAQTTLPMLQEHLQMALEITQAEKAEVPGATKSEPSGAQTR